MAREPIAREYGYSLERAGLFEQVCRIRHRLELGIGLEPCTRFPIEPLYLLVLASDDQQRRRAHARERLAREIGAAAARDDRPHEIGPLGSRAKRLAKAKRDRRQRDVAYANPGD